MFLKATSKFLPCLAAAALCAGLSSGASAHYNHDYGDWDVSSDAGMYDPIVLGESIELDACGATYFNYRSPSQSYSLCDLSNLSSFSLTWKGKVAGENGYTVLASYSGNNAANGLNVSISTGAGSFFSQAGTYYIGLYVTVGNNSWVLLPSGGYGYSNDNGGYDPGNQSLDWSSSFAINEATTPSVPEPAAALLLLPGLALIARRERRRRRNTKMA